MILDKIKNLFKKWDIGLVFGIGLAVLGLILLILPGSSLTTVCLILGIGVAVKGAVKLIGYLKAKQINAENSADLISAIALSTATIALFDFLALATNSTA